MADRDSRADSDSKADGDSRLGLPPGDAQRPTNPLRWIPQFWALNRRRAPGQARMLLLAVVVGFVAGLGAIAFYTATHVISHYALGEFVGYEDLPRPAGEPEFSWLPAPTTRFSPWLLLVVPTLGGLACGLIVYTLAPEAEGHGTDAVIAAYHRQQGYMRPIVPIVKIVASALTLGTGGSGGREGPIAQIGAGFASMLATSLRLGPVERRILLAAGMGAGIAAIFRAPLAGALFAAEVLYASPEFEPEVLLPAGIASVVSYCTFSSVFGWSPLFDLPDLVFSNPLELGPYLVLALVMAFLAMIYTRTFYGCMYLFHSWKVPNHVKPAVGALATGLLGLVLYFAFGRRGEVLGVLSFGYGSLQGALLGQPDMTIGVLIAIALGKIATTSLTIGSGGSAGVFGASMVIGGSAGGALGIGFHHLWPNLVPHPASFVVVGMAGFFAAAAKTPFSTLVMVSEITGGYQLLLPAMWVCVIAYMVSDEQSIYREQIATRAQSPAHHDRYGREVPLKT
jgi:CIC family chloride channel protein